MGEMMDFPERWEDFLESCSFKDKEELYTNGAKLIPTFRVEQMMDHYMPRYYHPLDRMPKEDTKVLLKLEVRGKDEWATGYWTAAGWDCAEYNEVGFTVLRWYPL